MVAVKKKKKNKNKNLHKGGLQRESPAWGTESETFGI